MPDMRRVRLEPSPALKATKTREVTPELAVSDRDRAEIMDIVRASLYDLDDLTDVAEEIGRSARCLYSIRSGYTRWPRWDTLYPLLRALGLRLYVGRVGINRKTH